MGRAAVYASLSLLLALLLAGCDRPERVFSLSGFTMGTDWSVQLVAPPGWRGLGSVRGEIEAILETVNSQMSTYREDSDISRFNRSMPGDTIPLRDEFRVVLEAALQLAEQTDGVFDPTVGPLVNLWGFGTHESRGAAPDEDDVAAALSRVGWKQLQVLGSALAPELLQQGGVDLNLSSIAKGYAVDLIAERLEFMGVSAYLVSIGGDMRLRGVRPDGQNWRIGVEHPVPGERRVHLVIEPGDRAVATSGDYRNFFFEDGRILSHVVDPRSGQPVEGNLASVTVLHESAMLADGLATAIMALGPERGYAFAAERDLAVLLLIREGNTFVERMSPQFKPFLAREAPAT